MTVYQGMPFYQRNDFLLLAFFGGGGGVGGGRWGRIFPNLYRVLLNIVFHTLESLNAGPVGVKIDLNEKRAKGNFFAKT